MVNWLRELLYFWTGKDLPVQEIEVPEILEYQLSARIRVDTFNAAHHRLNHEIKAITYHRIQVNRHSHWMGNHCHFRCLIKRKGKSVITTEHQFMFCNARKLPKIPNQSIDLVVTSPPYPMIQMWDELFKSLSDPVKKALNHGEGNTAFSLMHEELDTIQTEMYRMLKNGAFFCINIGDAVRTIDDKFQLFSNHSRVLSCCTSIGFDALPVILWRKQTNAPNKFMGSGMLPAGAYITLEHEFILVFRKGGKHCFDRPSEKSARQESAYF